MYAILTNMSVDQTYNNPKFSLKPGMSVITDLTEASRVANSYPYIEMFNEGTEKYLFEGGQVPNKPFEMETVVEEKEEKALFSDASQYYVGKTSQLGIPPFPLEEDVDQKVAEQAIVTLSEDKPIKKSKKKTTLIEKLTGKKKKGDK